MSEVSADLRARIATARALPSAPAVTARLIALCEDPDASIVEVTDVVNSDPALAARLMRLANSPVYARRRRSENVRQAVTSLGFDVVLTASLSLTLAATSAAAVGDAVTLRRRMWARSVYTATSAQILAETSGENPSDAFLAGLLQDIGIRVVDRLDPSVYESCSPDSNHDDLVAAELDRFGVDHAALGAELLADWNLPDLIVTAVGESHAAATMALSTIGHVAAELADALDGRTDSFASASRRAEEELGIDADAFSTVIERLTEVVPDLSALLDADAPDAAALAEMAQEALVLRHIMSRTAEQDLQDEVTSLRDVADELRAQNGLDSLTGLANRSRLDHMLAEEFAAAQRQDVPLSVLFVDLDDFKTVNDRFGHRVGDEVLTSAARRLSSSVRDGDLVARFGGEEFVVVLPGTSADAASVVSRRAVDSFSTRTLEFPDGVEIVQTISIGAATLDDDHSYDSPDDLLHAADEALYHAKRNGKSRFERADDAATHFAGHG